MSFESKYGLFEDEEGAKEAEEAIDKALGIFMNSLLEIEKAYPNVGLSDTEVRDSVIQEIVNKFP